MTDLQKTWKAAEAKALKLQADRDEAIAKVRDRYDKRLREANDAAADAQKAFLDGEAVASLAERPDGEQLARELVRQGGLSKAAVDEAFPT